MANFLITTPGQVTRGTTENDTVVYGANGISASTLIGNQGNDTVTFGASGTFQSTDFMMNQGNDVLNVDFAPFEVKSSNFFGGGADHDQLILSNATGGVNVFVAKGGSGKDTIQLHNISGDQVSVGGNAGHDAITISGSTFDGGSYIGGGKGLDTITVTGQNGSLGEVDIYGGQKADVISLSNTLGAKSVVNGDNGGDVISAGTIKTGSYINGNAGFDTITINGVTGTGSTIGGGQGADVIFVSGLNAGNVIAGGKGFDKITVSGESQTTTIIGGNAADTIKVEAGGNVFKYNTATESNYFNTDDITVAANDAGATNSLLVNSAVSVVNDLALVIRSGTSTVTGLKVLNGKIEAINTVLSGGTITATVEALDKLEQFTGKGKAVCFDLGDNSYVFIQGGSAGVNDDVLVKFNSAGQGVDGLVNGTTGQLIVRANANPA